ncbi:hypothetical protein QJQ45_010552 [Haematococcus lacustris]|nr:hypothetical protein QJQ45_010552 [Haematococcus lacustris]
MSQRDMQHQVAVDGGASATDGYSPAGEVPPPASRMLDLPPALLDDIACRVMQLGSRSLLPLTCRAFSQAHLLHIPALRIQLGRQRCDQLLTPRVVTALQARKSKLVITLWQPKKGDSAAFKWKWAPTLQLPQAEDTQQYTDLLAHALAKLDNCAAVEVCRLFSGEYHPNIRRHLRCPPGLAQHLLDSFPSLTALTLQGFLVSSNTLASLLSHPPLARQLQQLHLTTTYVLNGDKPVHPVLQGLQLKQLSICAWDPKLPSFQPLAQHLTQLHLQYYSDYDKDFKPLVEYLQPLAQLLVLTITCQQVQLQGLAELLQALPQLHTLQLPRATVRGQQKLDTLLAANQITSIQLQGVTGLDASCADAPCSWQRLELTGAVEGPDIMYLPLHSLSQPLVLGRLDIRASDTSDIKVAAALHLVAEAIKVPVHIKEVQLTMVRQELQHRTLTPTVITPTLLQHQSVDLAQLVSLLQPLQSCFVGKVQVRCLHEVTGADVLALAPLCRDCTHFELRGGSVEPSVDFWHQLVQLMPAVGKVDFIRVQGYVSAAMHESLQLMTEQPWARWLDITIRYQYISSKLPACWQAGSWLKAGVIKVLDSSNACIIPDDNSFVTTRAVPDTMPDSSGQARSGVGKTCLARAMVAQQAAKGGSGGAPLFFSVGERLRADGLLAKHVAPDERAACAETMRATARDLISRKLHALGQRVLVLEAVKDREGADDLAELLEQHSVPLLQQQLWWLEKALGIGWAGGQGGPPAHSMYGHPQVLYLPHDVSSAVATWGFGESRQRDAEHQVAERQAKWQRAAGWLLELYSSLGCLAEVSLLDTKGGSAQQPSLAALGYAAPAPECSWLAAAGWAPLGRWKKSSDTSSSSSSSSSSPGSSSAVSRSSMQQTWPGLAITPLQPVTSCRLVSCSRARAAVVAEAEAFTGLHPLPLPVPSHSMTCSADARWLAYPGRYLAALKADGVRHLLITTATGQPFLLNRAGALYAYPMQAAPSQSAAAGQEGALGGRAELEGEEGEEQQAASAGHITLEEELQQLSLQGSGAAEGQGAPARACDVVALPPAALPPCGLPCCTVLDGELVLHGGGAQPLFLVFDALCVAGSPVWQLPLTARLQHLDSLGLTTASEAVMGQPATSVFTPRPALRVPFPATAAPSPAAIAAAPPRGFVKQQQGPPRGQDTVLVLRKPCFPVSPSGLQQLEAAAERCGFPADGVVFSPCAMSSVLGQAELLLKWQPPGCVGVDVLGIHAGSLPPHSWRTMWRYGWLSLDLQSKAPGALVCEYMQWQVEVEEASHSSANKHGKEQQGPASSRQQGSSSKQQGPASQAPPTIVLKGNAWIMRSVRFDKVVGNSPEAVERLTQQTCLPWPDLVLAVQQQQQTAPPPSALHTPALQCSAVPPNSDLVPASPTSPHPARLLPFPQLHSLALTAVQCGSVEVSSDPDTGLQVFNYLAAASPCSSQAEQLCRGLVLHPDSQTLVATPFPRFAAEQQLDSSPCTVTRAAATALAPPPAGQPSSPAAAAVRAAVKVDGSLVIAFLWQGQVHACTRRRMTSEQAVWAQGQLRANPAFVAHAQPGWTYLFEAVYVANTHVIRYPFQGLVLLDAICPAGLGLASGAAKHALATRLGTLAAPELQLQQAEELGSWLQAGQASSSSTSTPNPAPTHPPASRPLSTSLFSFSSSSSPTSSLHTPSHPPASEGWVVTLGSCGQRIKLVHDSFKRAHYEAQQLHPLCVWDRVRQGASRDQLLPPWMPSHVKAEAEAVLAALHRSFQEVRLQHRAKGQAVAALKNGGREQQPLSMYYSGWQVVATPHLRAQLLDLVRPAHDGSGLPAYQPSAAMAQTFAKAWPKGPLAGRLAPSPEPACAIIQTPQFFELVLAALGGISALRAMSVCWTWCRLVRGWPGLVAAVEQSKEMTRPRRFRPPPYHDDDDDYSHGPYYGYRGYGNQRNPFSSAFACLFVPDARVSELVLAR